MFLLSNHPQGNTAKYLAPPPTDREFRECEIKTSSGRLARHAPAVILALLPNIANWCQSQIDGALGAAGTTAEAVGFDKLAGNGVIYRGMELFGGGATLAGLILGAIAVFIIDREFQKAAIYAGIGAVLAVTCLAFWKEKSPAPHASDLIASENAAE
jgi:hypothetical protein